MHLSNNNFSRREAVNDPLLLSFLKKSSKKVLDLTLENHEKMSGKGLEFGDGKSWNPVDIISTILTLRCPIERRMCFLFV